jgi:Na+/H+ antiporter NhaD/arsenite permease-like protein
MDAVAWMILIVFIGTYVAISSEKVNRTATSLLGMAMVGVVLVAAQRGMFSSLVEHVEWNTVLFVTAMMIIVTIASASGMFQYLAIEMTKPSRGNTRQLFLSFNGFVFVISLFLDTTSTMLIMGPLSIEVCKALEIDFRPFLISEAMTCNYASIPTIVGAVPNLVIAEEVILDQGLMFLVLMPLAVILFVFAMPLLLRAFEDQLMPSEEHLVDQMFLIDPSYMIRSRRDFYASVFSIAILILGFTAGHSVGFQPSMIAILIASILLLISRIKVDDILMKVNWGTVFFLVGLFGLVAGLQITGVIEELGSGIGYLVGENDAAAVIFMTAVPAILSAVIDNIPVSAVLAPIAFQFAAVSPLIPLALIFAVNVGGFILPIGSPATIMAIAFSEKEHKAISMKEFAKVATPIGLAMVGIGMAWFLILSLFI